MSSFGSKCWKLMKKGIWGRSSCFHKISCHKLCIFWPSKVSSQKLFKEIGTVAGVVSPSKIRKADCIGNGHVYSRMPIRITFQWTPTGKRKRVRLKITQQRIVLICRSWASRGVLKAQAKAQVAACDCGLMFQL